MRGMAGRQRDGPHIWANMRPVSDDAALPVDRVLRLAMDDDFDAGVDPQRNPCAQAAVCRAEVTACGRIAEIAREVPSYLSVAVMSARRCAMSGVATVAVIVVVIVPFRVLV